MPDHYALHLEKAREFYDNGNYEATRMAANHAIESTQPGDDNTEARTLLAMALHRLEYDEEAYQMLDEIVHQNPIPEAAAEYAKMRAERGTCDDECLKFAQIALDEDPDLASAHIAKFWYLASQNDYLEAIHALIRGLRRGAEFSERKVFELIRVWCQDMCNQQEFQQALKISETITDYFNSFDFMVLHARIAEFANEPRIAVKYYQKSLNFLRPGPMRSDILEAIARIAI